MAHTVVALAGARARWIIVGLAALFTLWQCYIFVWQPLSAETTLPAGLTSVRPQLDIASLTKIRDARAQRLQHTPNLFPDTDQYFAISPPASP